VVLVSTFLADADPSVLALATAIGLLAALVPSDLLHPLLGILGLGLAPLCTPSFTGRCLGGVPDVVQRAAVRPASSALTCQSRAAAARS
jgi:hypothetical protein